jgi:hypothetical protein
MHQTVWCCCCTKNHAGAASNPVQHKPTLSKPNKACRLPDCGFEFTTCTHGQITFNIRFKQPQMPATCQQPHSTPFHKLLRYAVSAALGDGPHK